MSAATTPAVDEALAQRLRDGLVNELFRSGDLHAPGWTDAASRTPRHVFIPRFYGEQGRDNTWPLVTPERVGVEEWLQRAYDNKTWVTQFDGVDPGEASEYPPTGIPTSSSTLPGLLLRMFEQLDVRDGDRMLIVGTGTGYSTALACERLGAEHVVSVDVDAAVAHRARARLESVGYGAVVLAGDGLTGESAHGPFDRIISFCAVAEVPYAWVRSSRLGAVIVVTLTGRLGGFGLVKLHVDGHGVARGRVLPDDASFMTARAQANPRPSDLAPLKDVADGPPRPVRVPPSILTDHAFRFAVQLEIPEVFTFDVRDGDARATYLQHIDGRSWARVEMDRGNYEVAQGGRRRLWDELETVHDRWTASGSPQPRHYRITLTEERQTIRLDAAS